MQQVWGYLGAGRTREEITPTGIGGVIRRRRENLPYWFKARLRRAGLRPGAVPGVRPGGRSGRGAEPQAVARDRENLERSARGSPRTRRFTVRPTPGRVQGAPRHYVMASGHP
jgi:hypothetical protein